MSSRISLNVVPEQRGRSKCCPGAAGQRETSKCCLGAAGQVERTPWSSKISRNEIEMASLGRRKGRHVVLEQLDGSKCRPGAAGQVEVKTRSSKIGRNVAENGVLEQKDRPTCRPRGAGWALRSARPKLAKKLRKLRLAARRV